MNRRNFISRASGLLALVPIVPVELIKHPEDIAVENFESVIRPGDLKHGEMVVMIRNNGMLTLAKGTVLNATMSPSRRDIKNEVGQILDFDGPGTIDIDIQAVNCKGVIEMMP